MQNTEKKVLVQATVLDNFIKAKSNVDFWRYNYIFHQGNSREGWLGVLLLE